jgi:hypothetical protein
VCLPRKIWKEQKMEKTGKEQEEKSDPGRREYREWAGQDF